MKPPLVKNDRVLIMEAVAGKRESFEELVERYHSNLIGWAYSLVHDHAGAQDIVQETFLRAYRSLNGYDPSRASVKTWMFGIVRNCAMEWQREHGRDIEFKESHVPFSEDNIKEDKLSLLEGALGELPEDTRQVLILKYWKDMSCEEISRELGKPIGTVMSLLSRSYKKLKEILREEKS